MHLLYIDWNVNPEIFRIGSLSLRYYGILFVSGIIMNIYVLKLIYKKEGIPLDNLDKLTIYGVVGVLLGARLGHCLFYEPAYYLSHLVEMFLPIHKTYSGSWKFVGYQGLASHGAIIGIICSLFYYRYKTKDSILKTMDYMATALPLGSTFIRLGNLMNSEIIGKPTDFSLAFIFHKVDELPRHAAQLYEALAYITIFIIMWYLYRKYRTKIYEGQLFAISLTLVFLARFIIEFTKEVQSDFETSMVLDMGQILSIPFIIIGVAFYFIGQKRKKVLAINQEPG